MTGQTPGEVQAAVVALASALQRTEANFIAAVNGRPVRDMAETLAENAAALAAAGLLATTPTEGACRCLIVGLTRDPCEPHIPAQAEWEQADDCPVHSLGKPTEGRDHLCAAHPHAFCGCGTDAEDCHPGRCCEDTDYGECQHCGKPEPEPPIEVTPEEDLTDPLFALDAPTAPTDHEERP